MEKDTRRTNISIQEKEYENFLQLLEAKNILRRYKTKDENGNIREKWDLKPGLIILN